ncbi:hypothetical protein FRX31_031788 [Thalictrum thalictroides]|uniref:Uncharacterized protein n=1 Tax=Thalictrum thalictroides TaxID=46969 RepID=A0A7J6V3B9_THATH|nr:hypothetical protein FRX31_031788 [Thalictrum thalictroides]
MWQPKGVYLAFTYPKFRGGLVSRPLLTTASKFLLTRKFSDISNIIIPVHTMEDIEKNYPDHGVISVDGQEGGNWMGGGAVSQMGGKIYTFSRSLRSRQILRTDSVALIRILHKVLARGLDELTAKERLRFEELCKDIITVSGQFNEILFCKISKKDNHLADFLGRTSLGLSKKLDSVDCHVEIDKKAVYVKEE